MATKTGNLPKIRDGTEIDRTFASPGRRDQEARE